MDTMSIISSEDLLRAPSTRTPAVSRAHSQLDKFRMDIKVLHVQFCYFCLGFRETEHGVWRNGQMVDCSEFVAQRLNLSSEHSFPLLPAFAAQFRWNAFCPSSPPVFVSSRDSRL